MISFHSTTFLCYSILHIYVKHSSISMMRGNIHKRGGRNPEPKEVIKKTSNWPKERINCSYGENGKNFYTKTAKKDILSTKLSKHASTD